MVPTHSGSVFQPLHRLFGFQPSAFLTLVSSFSSVHQGSGHRDGSAKICHHLGRDEAMYVFHIWSIRKGRDNRFFLEGACWSRTQFLWVKVRGLQVAGFTPR